MRYFLLMMVVLVLCAGCDDAPSALQTDTLPITPSVSTSAETPTVEPATPETTASAESATAEVTAAIELPTSTPEVTTTPTTTALTEPTSEATPEVTPIADAPAAAQSLLVDLRKENMPRQIALLGLDGTITPFIDIAANTRRVTGCGDEATSPDGRFFAFYAGSTAGNLYMIDAANPPVLVDSVEYLACLGNGTFRFSPDSRRFAYIDYPPGASSEEYLDGVLKIYDVESAGAAAQFENVTAFDLHREGAVFIRFFVNNRGEADEAAITLWDGTAAREIATLLPTGERCRFTSASISASPDEQSVALVLGQRCPTGNAATQWQFYIVDLTANTATLAASNYQPGAFASFSRSNNILFSPDGAFAYFTVPDGVTASTVAVAAVHLSDMEISVPVPRQAVFPSALGAANAYPRLSPDGRWLAMVVTSPNNDNQIVALDLTDPAMPPIAISAGSRSDVVSGLAFTPDSQQIIYVAGAANGGDNTLLALNLDIGSERRLARGHFDQHVILSPDNSTAALLDWQRVETPREPMFANLVLIDLGTNATTTLFTGADVVDGQVTNLRTATPLAWR